MKVPCQWLFQHKLANETLSTGGGAALKREVKFDPRFWFIPNFWITVFDASNEQIPDS